jgi:uncharacterized membrane protein
MFTVERDVVISRPIEQVFMFVENFENEPLYNTSNGVRKSIRNVCSGILIP